MAPLAGNTARAPGASKLAAEPMPSTEADTLLPASVVVTPEGVMSRIQLFLESETTTTPVEGMTARALGPLKLARRPTPSVK